MTETTDTPQNLSAQVPVRFPEGIVAAARHLAQRDGMSLSAWVRRVADREIARREGTCHSCGLPVPRKDEPRPAAAQEQDDAYGHRFCEEGSLS